MTASAQATAEDMTVFKFFGHLEVKDEEKGEVEAVVATVNVVDKDKEVITPAAIAKGSRVKMSSYGHAIVFMGEAPVGKGTLTLEGDKVLYRGRYFMTTTRGVEAFRTMKELGTEDQEWSFGFRVLGSEVPDEEWTKKGAWRILTKLDSFEVSPVLRGAGIGTGTRKVKAEGTEESPPPVEPPAPDPRADPPAQAPAKPVEQPVAPPAVPDPAAAAEAAAIAQTKADEAKAVADQAAEAKRLADEAEAKRVADAAEVQRLAAAAETKRLVDEAAAKQVSDAAAAEFERFQRTATTKEQHEAELALQLLRHADATEAKRLAEIAAAEFRRFQRTFQWLGA